ncbi:hypothetical protein [Stenotrophomonas maltophilia]|uniref:hypothetical protein n=1 Tax=Stenotrophomonas maltophilia TaxID=40324 RepID=UPI00313EBCDC
MFNPHTTEGKAVTKSANQQPSQQQEPAPGASSKACRLFQLGALVGTPAAMAVLGEAVEGFLSLVARHVTGDFGDVCAEDAERNREAIKHGDRIFSSYLVGEQKVWVITEADRSLTTLLLPSDY